MVSIKSVKDYFKEIRNFNHELMWSKIWDDTRRGIVWLDDLPSISPGRMAVGYNYLYVMTRILEEKQPCAVLDLGLGISSTLISQYFKHMQGQDGIHDIVEQSSEWVGFYLNKHKLSESSEIHVCACVEESYKGQHYNSYLDFEKVTFGKKYDVISIDGPLGSPIYSRRDILKVIPEVLNESFVIIMDDSQRIGEKSTIREVESILKKRNIAFCEGTYPGNTYCTVISSDDNRFLCTL